METDMQKAAEKLGAVNGLQCVVAEIGWIYEHHDELHELAKDNRDGMQGVVLEILMLGLDELRSIRRMIAEQEASERSENYEDCRPLFSERERSEKDCMWTDGCD